MVFVIVFEVLAVVRDAIAARTANTRSPEL